MDVMMETAWLFHGFSEEKRWSCEWMLAYMEGQRVSEYGIDLCPLKLLSHPEPPFWSLYMALVLHEADVTKAILCMLQRFVSFKSRALCCMIWKQCLQNYVTHGDHRS